MRQSRARWTFSVNNNANTLGEIGTCVSIFSVFVYIIAPAVVRGHEPSDESHCMSNMKQLGLALIGYTEDYDEKFPTGAITKQTGIRLTSGSLGIGLPATHAGRTHGIGVGWAGSAYEYIKSPGVFHCPEDKTEPLGNPTDPTAFPISYAMNEWIAGQSQEVLAGASTTVLLFECSGLQVDMTNHLESGGPNHSPVGDGASDPATGIPAFGDGYDSAPGLQHMIVNNQGAFARHDVNGAGGGASMYLLGDGHVKFLRYDDVSVGKRPVSQSKLGNLYKASFNPVK